MDVIPSRRIDIGLAILGVALFAWALVSPLFGEQFDFGFFAVAGALALNSTTDLVSNRRLRYAMMALSMALIVAFFAQR